ncbi:hypothetical protein LZG75_02145 [Polynucleobacter sp. IMCC30063]|uniref:hypothetical protein n=1 Tax=Polynucleobacter sp. IMCC30063 TaxID=2907298 RepID=UPI001F21FCE3|nr:hypothetical protein [Polynucleobacter sp. IMCC30063]MCE7505029.1 hypothetical protein [Polynucleobacter sp. IMCC30063]
MLLLAGAWLIAVRVGGIAQDVSNKMLVQAKILRKRETTMLANLFDAYPSLLFVLEALLALGLLLFIVFWTGSGRKD